MRTNPPGTESACLSCHRSHVPRRARAVRGYPPSVSMLESAGAPRNLKHTRRLCFDVGVGRGSSFWLRFSTAVVNVVPLLFQPRNSNALATRFCLGAARSYLARRRRLEVCPSLDARKHDGSRRSLTGSRHGALLCGGWWHGPLRADASNLSQDRGAYVKAE